MSDYSADHASALIDVQNAGASVTWSKTTPGTYDAETDTYTDPVTTTCAGSAVEEVGDDAEYQALELIASSPITLFFTPTTYGDLPSLDMTGTWAGATRSIKRIRPLRPGGTVIGAWLVVV